MDMVPGTENYVIPVPKPQVELVGQDGNAFFIIGRCQRALRRAGVEKAIIDAFVSEATSGDYDKVLQTAMKYCDVY